MLIYGHDATDDLNRAISDFSANNMDPKAAILPTYSQIGEGVIPNPYPSLSGG